MYTEVWQGHWLGPLLGNAMDSVQQLGWAIGWAPQLGINVDLTPKGHCSHSLVMWGGVRAILSSWGKLMIGSCLCMVVGWTLWLPGLPDQVGMEAIFKN